MEPTRNIPDFARDGRAPGDHGAPGTALSPKDLRIFYIRGEGGIGKTRLLQEALRKAKTQGSEASSPVVFEEPVDFYHYPTHSIQGLARALRAVLPQSIRAMYFGRYDDLLVLAQEAQRRGDTGQAETLIQEALEPFEDAFIRLTRFSPLVMAFDTLEVLGRVDPEQQILSWLFRLVRGTTPNASRPITVLLAGRPQPEVEAFLHEQGELERLDLTGLSSESVAAYMRQLAEVLRQKGQGRLAERLKQLTAENCETITLLTAGRPILVGLVAEMWLGQGVIPDIFRTPAEKLRHLAPAALEQKQEETRNLILSHLWTLRNPWRSTLAVLMLTRKGLTAPLLSALHDISEEEARARLEKLSQLSFVKTRPFESELRVYLHDELYALLESSYPNPVRRAEILKAIAAWYETKRQTLTDKLREHYAGEARSSETRSSAETRSPAEEIIRLHEGLQQVKIEQVHYALRADWREGLARFVHYSLDAYTLWEPGLDEYLQGEVRDYLGYCDDPAARMALEWELSLAQVRNLILKRDFRQAQERLNALQGHPDPGAIHQAHRAIWRGVLAREQGNFEQAEGYFRQAESQLQGMAEPEHLLKFHLKALLYIHWGYALRLQYKNRRAAEIYSKAIAPLRRLDNRYELAELHKNQAFCLAESGQTRQARLLIKDALGLARQEGAAYLEGLSWNTLALIQIRDGHPHEALAPALKALEIFKSLGNQRGEGLACLALAQAYRRRALESDVPPREQRTYNDQAKTWAEKAVDIFQRFAEPIRLIEAWIEAGSAYRDRVWIEHESFGVPVAWLRNAPDLADQARQYFQKVRTEQEAPLFYRLDAFINQGLLELYLENFDQAERSLAEAERLVADEYRIRKGAPYPPRAGEEGIWLSLGKLYHARAHLLWRQNPQNLPAIVESTTLALAYDELFDPEAYGTQRGLKALHSVMKKLPHQRLEQVYREAWRTAQEYNLPRSRSDPEKRTLMLRFLEEHFGASEDYLAPEELAAFSTE